MKILFIHPNFPGQFVHIAKYFAADQKNEVIFACRFPNKIEIPGVKKVVATSSVFKKNAATHQYLREFETATYRAQDMWRMLDKLKRQGFTPDVIYAHSGWGDGMLVKDIYPDSKYISYMEFYYRAHGADIGFDPTIIVTEDLIAKIRIRNATNLINMVAADWLISPTHWQAHLHPQEFHQKYLVIHEGIDTEKVKPSNNLSKLLEELNIPKQAEIITYIARNFEPYRGFDQAMQAIEIISQQRPNAHFIIIGGDEVSYGAKLPGNQTYKERMLKQVKLDEKRTHWLGKVPYDKYLEVLNCSHAHIYLTYPFVLSWSLLEAMAMECPIVASNTAPVAEVAVDNLNSLLVDFFNPAEIASKVIELLNDREKAEKLGKSARQTILKKYSLDVVLPEYINLINDINEGRTPTNANKLKPKCLDYKIS